MLKLVSGELCVKLFRAIKYCMGHSKVYRIFKHYLKCMKYKLYHIPCMEVKSCTVTARVMYTQKYKFIVFMKQHLVHSHLITNQAQLAHFSSTRLERFCKTCYSACDVVSRYFR